MVFSKLNLFLGLIFYDSHIYVSNFIKRKFNDNLIVNNPYYYLSHKKSNFEWFIEFIENQICKDYKNKEIK